ncbi:protein tonB [Stenotrophomonas sp. Iso1]|uniref:protein tonB n=1 Tax=Stenotrophomonas sp. Iso1 TaxID=2977283 RepID=UPI0022B78037|nr:protein tonB [Stenotrophomonas sp. Iso1]
MRHMLAAMAVGAALMAGMPAVASAGSGGISAVRERVESSMVVRGEVTIETDGSVSAIKLEKEEALPTALVDLVRNAALKWRFEPVLKDGVPVRGLAPMSLRVIARELDHGRYEVSLGGINFNRVDSDGPEGIAIIDSIPPRYPQQAIVAGVSGSVYLVLKVGRDGKVEDAFAEQVNLTVLGREGELRRSREMLAASARDCVRQWTFRIPTQGQVTAQRYWNVRVPVSYSLNKNAPEGRDVGRWVTYVPGPRERAPWLDASEQLGFSPDALADGSVNLVDNNGPRLLTPLQGS